MSSTKLSRRAILAGASASVLPAGALAATSTSACTLPPDLIERFVRMRAWYLDSRKRETLWGDEVDRRFYAATGLTDEEWCDIDRDHPRWNELRAARDKIYAEVPGIDRYEGECEELGDERWAVAEAIMAHKPQTFADLAWQAEAYLIGDLEVLTERTDLCTSAQLIRTLFGYIRTLGALPQPDDPLGALSLDIDSDGEEVQS
jgi:hypothetical protein